MFSANGFPKVFANKFDHLHRLRIPHRRPTIRRVCKCSHLTVDARNVSIFVNSKGSDAAMVAIGVGGT